MFVVLATIFLIAVIVLLRHLYLESDIEAIRTSRVIIVGYLPDDLYHNAYVECRAINGRTIRLIDKGMKLQNRMVIPTTEPVWIRYHMEQSWFIFFDFDIYIDDFYIDSSQI